VAALHAWSTTLGRLVVVTKFRAGCWAGGAASLVHLSVVASHVARLRGPPADVYTLGVTGLSVRGHVCAQRLAVGTALAGTAVVHAVLVVTVYVNDFVAFSEDGALHAVAGGLGPVLALWVGDAGRLRIGGQRAGHACPPSVSEREGLRFNLTSASAVVVVRLTVEVTAQTAHLTVIAGIEDDLDAHGAVPQEGDTVLCFDVGVETSFDNLVMSFPLDSRLVADDWCSATDEVEDGVQHREDCRLGAGDALGSAGDVFCCYSECVVLAVAAILGKNVGA
jgi:hypothetical protein